MQQQQPPSPQQYGGSSSHVSSGNVTPPRVTRLLYRRGLPNLPELIEAEEDEVVAADDISMYTYSTQHSKSTSTSSREFVPSVATSTGSPSLKGGTGAPSTPSGNRSFHEIFTQTPPESGHQLQRPFDYVPSAAAFQLYHRCQEEPSPPPSPIARDETLVNAGVGYGLEVGRAAYETFPAGESGMGDDYHERGIDEEFGNNVGNCEGCPECAGFQQRSLLSGPYGGSSSSGEVDSPQLRVSMSPPSSPGTDCMQHVKRPFGNMLDGDDLDGFYGLSTESYPVSDRPRSPSLLIDNDTFSSVPALPTIPSGPSSGEVSSPDRGSRSSRSILGRRGQKVLNAVIPRALRLKRWSSTPVLPKLQISSPPPLPRMASSSHILSSGSQSQGFRTPGVVPPNTAFDYDPYSERMSDEEDEDECCRPTTRGTMMSREQLPTPPFLPTIASTLPYIPPLDSPVSVSLPQSPSASMHNLALSTQPSVFPQMPPPPHSTRNNSISSLSNVSFISIPPVSPTFMSPTQRPFEVYSPIVTSPAPTLNMAPIRTGNGVQHSPQFSNRQFFQPATTSEDVESLLQHMDLEDDAFAATEQRMATSGWSTETELTELRAKRASVRREWEERIHMARKNRRGSDVQSTRSSHYTADPTTTSTPVITLQTNPNVSTTALTSTIQQQ